jgi:hypothetical protein
VKFYVVVPGNNPWVSVTIILSVLLLQYIELRNVFIQLHGDAAVLATIL